MTKSPADTIRLQAASGQTWLLNPIRPLSPSVQLTVSAENPTDYFALKTLNLPSDEAVQAALQEASLWRRAYELDPTNIVRLHAIAVDKPNVYFIMEYCPGGDISSTRSERTALRILSGIAAAVDLVVTQLDQPAHANLSTSHVLLDAAATPKIAGFGMTRARRLRNPRRKISERDDVKAIVAILYEMLYGTRYDVSRPLLPEEPSVSKLTAALIKNILFQKNRPPPDVTLFRYSLAAARRLVPSCTPALAPVVNHRREEFLDLDLNSTRGLSATDRTSSDPLTKAILVPPTSSSSQGSRAMRNTRPAASPTPPISGSATPPAIVVPVSNSSNSSSQLHGSTISTIDLGSDSAIDEVLRTATAGDLNPSAIDEVDRLLEACSQYEALPDKVFKVLFKLPISKNPSVAFKVITLIHRLIAEGPAKLTALAITNDGFLSWIESSWSRERIQNKTGKVHAHSFCFEAGEISWYTAMIRKRIEVHGKFAQVFSTHWVARPDGLSSLDWTRRDAYRLVLDVIEKCSTILQTIVTAKDGGAPLKFSAVPILVAEVAKAYHAICWLYSTSNGPLKQELQPELAVAHNATKNGLDAVRRIPELESACPRGSLLRLENEVPKEFDTEALMSSLKKKKRRKKKRADPENGAEDSGDIPKTSDRNLVSESSAKHSGPSAGGTPAYRTQDVKDPREDMSLPGFKRGKHPPTQGVVISSSERTEVPAIRDALSGHGTRKEQFITAPNRATRDVYGLQKLSLSVRRGDMRTNGAVEPAQGYNRFGDVSPGTAQQTSTPGRGHLDRRLSGLPYIDRSVSQDDERYSDLQSDTSSTRSLSSGNIQYRKDSHDRGRRKHLRHHDSSDSETESDEEKPSVRRRGSKKTSAKRSSGKPDVAELEEDRVRRKKSTKKKPVKSNHADEKSIPFDKEHPRRKGVTKSKTREKSEDHGNGAREALSAAAKGKKTPSMNPKFEVAPYEVQYGPQVGSGGFGVVYKAKFRNETVAVKKIHGHALSNASSVREFISEVAVLCNLRHPNILLFVGACTKPPNLMIITEFMSRGTLFDVLHQSNMRVTWPMRKKFALDTCKGMRYLHEINLLHRDLKSSNLMLDKDFNCKVGDFGLTRTSRGTADVQMTGQCGTFQYMAVEVLANKPYSEKADVFSFGILLWEMVARKLPFFGMQPMQVGMAVLNQGLRPTIPPKCPAPLAKMMRACWDSDPHRRPSFAQLVEALESMPE